MGAGCELAAGIGTVMNLESKQIIPHPCVRVCCLCPISNEDGTKVSLCFGIFQDHAQNELADV